MKILEAAFQQMTSIRYAECEYLFYLVNAPLVYMDTVASSMIILYDHRKSFPHFFRERQNLTS